MAKRPVKRTQTASKKRGKVTVPKRTVYPCKIHGKGKCQTAYMRVEKSGNAGDGRSHYCAPEWKRVVESKKEFAQAVTRAAKAAHEARGGGGVKGSAKRASASKRRVVKKGKK